MGSTAPAGDKRTIMANVLDWWLARVWPDVAIVALVVVTHFTLYRWWSFDHVDWALQDIATDQRRIIYLGLATVSALVAGSNNTAVGSYVSSAGDVMKEIRVSHGRAMRKSLRSNGMWLWLVAVTSLVCVALDPMRANNPEQTRGASWIAEAALLLIVVKYGRLLMMQDVLLAANDLSRKHEIEQQRVASRRRLKRPGFAIACGTAARTAADNGVNHRRPIGSR